MGNKKSSVGKLLGLIAAIALITYNVVLFAACGFKGHGGSFWISYVFVLISIVTLAISAYMLKGQTVQPKDWLLGYPVLKHCTTYLVIEIIVSTIFIALDYIKCPWVFALVIQLLLSAAFLVFIISCFLVKEVTESVEIKIEKKTSFMKMFKVDANMLAERATDEEVKNAFKKLAEEIRYSDPVSVEALSEVEGRISNLLEQAKTINDKEDLLRICNSLNLLLKERNQKCKALK